MKFAKLSDELDLIYFEVLVAHFKLYNENIKLSYLIGLRDKLS
jgi:hypothetical protein